MTTQLRSSESDSLAQRMLRDQVDSMLSTSRSLALSGFLVVACFAAIFYHQTRLPMTGLWLLFMASMQVVRLVGHMRYVRLPPAQRKPEQIAKRYCYAMALSSSGWGLAQWLSFPEGTTGYMSLWVIILPAIISGGTTSLAPYRPALFYFLMPMLVGIASTVLWQHTALHAFLVFSSVAYMLIQLRYGLRLHSLLSDALRAKYEKEDIAERLAEQVKAVERASLEKTRFLASASHDLRQPLHSLGLFGAALLSRLKTTDHEPLARNLMLCVDALETSFSSMLDVSKLDAGVVQVKNQPVALGEVFRRLQASYGRHAESQNLALRFKPNHKWVLVDAALLERLLGNLIHNALKFTQRGGVVVLARTRASHISIEVWDSGPGIDPYELPRIFDEFYQVGNRERDRAMGLGMGLAIVRRLSKLMNVPLSVQSRVGRGTVFKLLVPSALAVPTVVTTPEPTIIAFRALAGSCVLIVDDEENVRVSTQAALRLYGLHVVVADSVSQAHEVTQQLQAQGIRLDALITDFRLRDGEDGITLTHELRAMLGRHLPTLLITGDTAPERVRQAQESGLRTLYKPVKIQNLVEELRSQLAQKP